MVPLGVTEKIIHFSQAPILVLLEGRQDTELR